MLSKDEWVERYWRYYLSLENRLLSTRNYITFSGVNYSTYSNEYISLMLLIGGEFDNISKEICGYPGSRDKNISDYVRDLSTIFQDISNKKVKIDYFGEMVYPLNIGNGTKPVWWESYNKIKHNRINFEERASLSNIVLALSSIYLLNRLQMMLLDTMLYETVDKSRLYHMAGWPDEHGPIFIATNECVVFDPLGE